MADENAAPPANRVARLKINYVARSPGLFAVGSKYVWPDGSVHDFDEERAAELDRVFWAAWGRRNA